MQSKITAVDLFCGAGGLSYGLQKAGVSVIAGVDTDGTCKYPFERNIDAAFLQEDVRDITSDHLAALWAGSDYSLLAGCAPCQPFSSYRRGANTSGEDNWPLLREFGRLVTDSCQTSSRWRMYPDSLVHQYSPNSQISSRVWDIQSRISLAIARDTG